MTVPNTLPIPHSPHANAAITDSGTSFEYEESLQNKSLSSMTTSDDLRTIVTTPSSITEQPLITQDDDDTRRTRKQEWYQQLKPPYAMMVISSVQVCLYTYFTLAHPKGVHGLLFDPQRQRQAWRFVTYMLLHKDCVHLIQNVLLQCLFGVYLETFETSWKTLLVYIGGGIGGALGAAAVCTDLIVGASAGVYALLLSYVAHIIFNYKSMKYRKHLIISVSIIVISDIFYCAGHYVYNATPTISSGAHLFGALNGLLIGLTIFGSGTKSCDKQPYMKKVSIFSAILLILVSFLLVIADLKNMRALPAKKILPTQHDREY